MEWGETYRELTNLLSRGETDEVLARTEWMLVSKNWFSEYASEHEKAEVWALRGTAFCRRSEYDRARMSLESALGYDPANERAILGLKSLNNEVVKQELMRSREEKRYGPAI